MHTTLDIQLDSNSFKKPFHSQLRCNVSYPHKTVWTVSRSMNKLVVLKGQGIIFYKTLMVYMNTALKMHTVAWINVATTIFSARHTKEFHSVNFPVICKTHYRTDYHNKSGLNYCTDKVFLNGVGLHGHLNSCSHPILTRDVNRYESDFSVRDLGGGGGPQICIDICSLVSCAEL